MTRITAVRSRMLRIPLDNPTSFSNRTVYHRDHPVVAVECDDGHTGIGFCYAGSSNGQLVTSAVDNLFAPLLLGRDPFRVEGLWAEMYQESLLHGRAGVTMRALSALDIALWDHNAKAAGLPLYKLLGAYYVVVRERVEQLRDRRDRDRPALGPAVLVLHALGPAGLAGPLAAGAVAEPGEGLVTPDLDLGSHPRLGACLVDIALEVSVRLPPLLAALHPAAQRGGIYARCLCGDVVVGPGADVLDDHATHLGRELGRSRHGSPPPPAP